MKRILLLVTLISMMVGISTMNGQDLKTAMVNESLEQVSATAFESYSIGGYVGVINSVEKTVLVTLLDSVVPLVPTFSVTDSATTKVSISQVSQTTGVSVVDFGEDNEVVYTIINGVDSSEWTVTIEYTVSIMERVVPIVSTYPNPTNSIVIINSDVTIETIILYNVFGREVNSFITDRNKYSIDLSNYSNGVYLININNSKTVRVIKN